MTQAIAKKVAKLTKTTDKYISRVDTKDNPFASSAAKYYPALKKLASK
jgi:hypothetical protein